MIKLKLYDSLFDSFFCDADPITWDLGGVKSRNNMIENRESKDSYEYYLPLAGFKKEDVKAIVKDNGVYVTAKQGEKKSTYSFGLLEDVDISTLSASHKDGLLTVKVDKKKSAKNIELKIE